MCFQSWLVPELFVRPGDLEKREHFVAKHPRATLTLTFQQCILNCWYKKIAGHGRNWHKPCNGCRFESHETVNLITLSYKWTVWFIAGIKLMVTLEKKKKTKQNHQDLMADSGDIQTDCVIKTRGIENTHVSLACRLHVWDYLNYSLKPWIQFIVNISLWSTII